MQQEERNSDPKSPLLLRAPSPSSPDAFVLVALVAAEQAWKGDSEESSDIWTKAVNWDTYALPWGIQSLVNKAHNATCARCFGQEVATERPETDGADSAKEVDEEALADDSAKIASTPNEI